eukprot:scaffold478621_cov14-Prasinocladus_malaysianus.AAC.1
MQLEIGSRTADARYTVWLMPCLANLPSCGQVRGLSSAVSDFRRVRIRYSYSYEFSGGSRPS